MTTAAIKRAQEVLDTLVAARKILENPLHWTKRVFARNINNRDVSATDPTATCFCVIGAICKAADVDTQGPMESHVLDAASGLVARQLDLAYYYSVSVFNDLPSTTHADILKTLDAAIEDAKKQLQFEQELAAS